MLAVVVGGWAPLLTTLPLPDTATRPTITSARSAPWVVVRGCNPSNMHVFAPRQRQGRCCCGLWGAGGASAACACVFVPLALAPLLVRVPVALHFVLLLGNGNDGRCGVWEHVRSSGPKMLIRIRIRNENEYSILILTEILSQGQVRGSFGGSRGFASACLYANILHKTGIGQNKTRSFVL